MKKGILSLLALAVAMTGRATIITTVGSVSDMQELSSSVNTSGDSYSGVTVTLTADLDFSEAGSWEPVGTDAHPFTGTFDGQGHTVSNLSADGSKSFAAGLFGVVGGGGVVKDVNIGSGTIFISENPGYLSCYLGSIVGLNEGTVVGCSSAATVSGYSYEHARIGGIAGTNNGIIQNCCFLGTVYTGLPNVFIGGIVGYNKEKGNGTVQNCFTRCKVVTSVSVEASYPLCGNNNGGTVTGCFYANGTEIDEPVPFAVINDADNSAAISENDGKVRNVLLSGRTLYADGDWNTLCLPFDIPASGNGRSPIAGATVKELDTDGTYDAGKKTGYDSGSGTLYLYFKDATSIEAGKPYIVKWPSGSNIGDPVFCGVIVANEHRDVTSEDGKVVFKGTFSPALLQPNTWANFYLGDDNMLYYPDADGFYVNAFRAYFTLKLADPIAGVRDFIMNLDEDAAGIQSVESGEFRVERGGDDIWYDLNGRRLNGKPTKPGIYIKNGKKISNL